MKFSAMWLALLYGVLLPALLGREAARSAEPIRPPEGSGQLLVQSAEGIGEMDMDTYLTGVLLGEMPADFEPEALKAQAVAARTLACKSRLQGYKHPDADVCTDPGCCQAYCPEEAYLASGGSSADVEKIRKAVRDTRGQVQTYQGQLIEATYFSCSGGRTEDAFAVWGAHIP